MLDFGPKAFEAAQRLKYSDDWKVVLAEITRETSRFMHTACETADPVHCGYARGLRDVVWAFELMEAGPDAPPSRQAMKPTVQVVPPGREKARV